MGGSKLLSEVAAALAMLGLVVLFNPGLALEGRVLGGYDAFVYFYPLRSYIAETLGQGRLPLWNSYLFAGTPYLANPQTAVFYPGTWLFTIVDTPHAYALNFLAHLWIAGIGVYAFARLSLGLGRLAGLVGGAAFAFSGFMNGQAGHINQFSAVAWLPVVALALDAAIRTGRLLPVTGLLVGLALQIVAGHPQQVYMTVVVLGMLLLWRAVSPWERGHPGRLVSVPNRGGRDGRAPRRILREALITLVRGGLILGLALGLAAGISAIQLLPTLELSALSIRGGGLSYQLAAFDALPWPLLLPALFPGYWSHLPTTEFFGHLSTVVFALAWVGLLAGCGRPAFLGAVYVAIGLLLAVGDATSLYRFLYDWAPGFASFRVPARWLLISTFGLTILAAVGTDWLVGWVGRHRPPIPEVLGGVGIVRGVFAAVLVPLGLASLVLVGQPQSRWLLLAWGSITLGTLLLAVLIVLAPRLRTGLLAVLVLAALTDLWLAGRGLEHRNPIPNLAYHQSREAIDELQQRVASNPGFRMLSIATTEYVPKETGEYEERYAGLSRLALDNLLYTVKWNETLLPNVPLVHRLATADGYDGGVLPLRNFYLLGRAMLGPERARPDGVLASRLDALPESRWLDLLGVRWAIASRVKDDTRGAVYYDRAISQILRPGQSFMLTALPGGSFTKLGLISSLAPIQTASGGQPGQPPATGTTVGTIRLDAGDGAWQEVPLVVGQATAPERWPAEQAPALERVESWSGRAPDAPADWIAEIDLPHRPIARLQIVNSAPDQILQIRALNLIDDDRQMAFPITPDSRIERVDLFDLKLYDRQNALPRAYVVNAAQVLDDDGAARRLNDPTFDPSTGRQRTSAFDPHAETILAPSRTAQPLSPASAGASSTGTAAFELDEPERIRIRARSDADGFLVLSDSWYPGWIATVDGQEVPIERANLLFRAIRLGPGEHLVELRYEPRSVRTGALVSVGSVLATIVLLVGIGLWQRRRRGAHT